MKLAKSLLHKKYSFFLREHISFKRMSKRVASEQRNLRLKQKANALLSFVLVSNNSKIFRKLNKEKNFLRNWDISASLEQNTSIVKEEGSVRKDRIIYINAISLTKVSPIALTLKKEICLSKWKYYKQLFFLLKEITQSLSRSNILLLRESFSFLHGARIYSLEEKANNFFQNTMSQIFFKKKNGYIFNAPKAYINAIFFKALQKHMIYTAFLGLISNMEGTTENLAVKKSCNLFIEGLSSEVTFWEGTGLPQFATTQIYSTMNIEKALLKQKKVISMIRRRSSPVLKQHLFGTIGVKNDAGLSLKNFIWKRNNYFFVKGTPNEVTKLAHLLNKKLKYSTRRSSIQMLYLFSRIEEKLEEVNLIEDIKNKETAKTNLLILQGLLTHLLREKKERAIENNMLLAPVETIFKSRRKTWKLNLMKSVLVFLGKQNYANNNKFQNFVKVLHKKLSKPLIVGQKTLEENNTHTTKEQKAIIFALNARKRRALILAKVRTEKSKALRLKKLSKLPLHLQARVKIREIQLKRKKENMLKRKQKFFTRVSNVINVQQNSISAKPWQKPRLSVRRTWVGVKPIIAGKYTTFAQKKHILAAWAGRPIDLFFINTLSLSKFAFKLERIDSPQNRPNRFLSIIERDFINKYKYVAIYIKDLVRIGFISMFLKKPSFLAKFAAFQLAKLPRNRKETVFIRFLMKAIRTFAAGRKEILAVRIKIKGRVNRWRRTKYIIGTRGTLPLQTMSERIEQGTAQAINRKGAVGVRIWLRYKPSFLFKLHSHILTYMRYSRLVKLQRRRKAIILK